MLDNLDKKVDDVNDQLENLNTRMRKALESVCVCSWSCVGFVAYGYLVLVGFFLFFVTGSQRRPFYCRYYFVMYLVGHCGLHLLHVQKITVHTSPCYSTTIVV